MRLGSSVPWAEALYVATGESRLNGSYIREYFRPLEDWLRNENLRTNEYVGWSYGKFMLTLWHPNYVSTPCRSNANNTGTKKGSIMK
jgi:hypothetical protein